MAGGSVEAVEFGEQQITHPLREEREAEHAGPAAAVGQSACTWVEAHVRQTPMDGGTATALVRTRLAEKHIERHKTDGTYIAPAEVPIIGLPPGDPLLQAPWHGSMCDTPTESLRPPLCQ